MFWRKRTNTEQINTEKDMQIDALPDRTETHHTRAVVDGRLYDTENSECLTLLENNRYLFKTPNGNYFSCIAQHSTEITETGKILCVDYLDIRPESIEGAKNVIGKYDIKKYIELFGEPELA